MIHHPDAPNTPKIDNQLDALKRIRAANGIAVGWNPGEIIPPTANALQRAGLCVIIPTAAGRVVKPVDPPK